MDATSLSPETFSPAPKPIADRHVEVLAIHAEIFGAGNGNGKHTTESGHSTSRTAANLDDAALLDKARRANNGAKFSALYDRGDWQGEGYPSQSEAVMGLCCELAFWTRDASRIDRLFRQSALMSGDWESEKWDRLGERTIGKAIEQCSETYNPAAGGLQSKPKERLAADAGTTVRADYRDELAVSERLLARHQENLLWAKGLDYHVWDGRRWQRDDTEHVYHLAEDIAKSLYDEAVAADVSTDEGKALFRLACSVSKRCRLEGAIKIARSHVAVSPDDLDAQPYLLNVRNGTVDLRTGELRSHTRGDRITKLIDLDYIKDAPCPRWQRFLNEIFPDDDDLINYIQCAIGLSIAGDQREKAFFFLWGPQDTGKTTLFNVAREVFGEYAQTVPKSVFLEQYGDKIRSDIARLRGARFACASEMPKGAKFDIDTLKMLTGAEGKLTARFLHQNEFEWSPTHRLWLASNPRPHADADDGAFWVRLKLIPCLVIHEDPTEEKPEPKHPKDKNLLNTLRSEYVGILAWAIAGARKYYKQGLSDPKCVRAAGKAYQTDENRLLRFVTQCVERNVPEAKTKRSDMFKAYRHALEGERTIGKQALNDALRDQYGFVADHDRALGDIWLNVKLREGALPPEKK